MQLKSFVQNEIINFPHLTLMPNLSPIMLIKLFLFFTFKTSGGFSFQFEACIIYCFHVYFVFFYYVLDLFMVVYAPRVYLSEIKVNIYLFFFVNQLLFIIESMDAFYFINNVVVYKALYKQCSIYAFISNLTSDFSKVHRLTSPRRPYRLSYSGVGVEVGGIKFFLKTMQNEIPFNS